MVSRPSLGAIAVAALAAGCTPGPLSGPRASGPMNKPVALNAEEGSGNLEAARRRLTGTWELVALEYSPKGDGERVPIQAKGTLTYDEFGNLTIDAHTTDQAAPEAAREANTLSFKGRAVIDVARNELKMMDLTGNVDPNEVLSPEHRRKYEFEGDMLTLTSFNAQGQPTAVSKWRRRE